ncbi:MAG: hypothetical protein JRI68_02650, partial [Deltaproteobacteria bacterium]|nr:hypothetical protein [Deltaproteobacteria bacterium]
MGAERDQDEGLRKTAPPQSGTAPHREIGPISSGPAPASLPGCVGRLLTIASATERGADLRATIHQLLEVLVELDPRTAAGVCLRRTGTRPELVVVVNQASVEFSARPPQAGGRLFPGLAEEHVMALPGVPEGTFHFGAPSFEAGPFSERGTTASRETLLDSVAGVVAMVVRALGAETRLEANDATIREQQKLAAIGRNAAGIVHELNNPLTAIVAYADYLTQRLDDDERQRTNVDRLRRISEAASRIQLFCRELTDYSRPSGRLRAPVDLHAIIDRALSFCMHDLRDAEITVERRYRDVPPILGMDSELIQLFVNLITNAGDAMTDSGGTLSLETKVDGGRVVVAVADQGRGIAAADLPHVFDSYFPTKPKGQGVGLGLDIARRIVADHG